MNIFWISAFVYGWRHLVKMPLEAAQCAFAVWHLLEGIDGFWCQLDGTNAPPAVKPGKDPSKSRSCKGLGGMALSHKNHPVIKWMCMSGANYLQGVRKGREILEVYHKQYHRVNKKPSALFAHLDWLEANVPPSLFDTVGEKHLTVAPVCPPTLLGRDPESWTEVRAAYEHIYAINKTKIALDLGKMPSREEYDACKHTMSYETFMSRRRVAPWITDEHRKSVRDMTLTKVPATNKSQKARAKKKQAKRTIVSID
jgi:hypothetical protein